MGSPSIGAEIISAIVSAVILVTVIGCVTVVWRAAFGKRRH